MLASKLTVKELIKENRRLLKNLSRRIANIEALGSPVPLYAVDKFRQLEKTIPKNISRLDRKSLTTLNRDLRYINALKTSTVKGAKKAQETWIPIERNLKIFSPNNIAKFWEIYNKIYERMGGLTEKYKYELFDTITDFMYQGSDSDAVVEEIIDQFDDTLKELGGNATDEKVKVLFSSKLKKLF